MAPELIMGKAYDTKARALCTVPRFAPPALSAFSALSESLALSALSACSACIAPLKLRSG
jgi:hypothetical protein